MSPPNTDLPTAMVVDDDPMNLDIMLLYLEEWGFHSLIAQSGERARSRWTTSRIRPRGLKPTVCRRPVRSRCRACGGWASMNPKAMMRDPILIAKSAVIEHRIEFASLGLLINRDRRIHLITHP